MVLISLQPLDLKKAFLLILGLLCVASAALADPVLLSVPSTPYDRQMTRIQPVLFSKAGGRNENLSMAVVNHWIQDLRGIPYGFSQEWKTPAEVEKAPVADCKGKAVALYQKMHASGARNIRLVIGKRFKSSRKTHAWLEWNTDEGTYVLDPTINWAAYRSPDVGRGTYLPLYAYAGSRKFRAANATLLAKN